MTTSRDLDLARQVVEQARKAGAEQAEAYLPIAQPNLEAAE